MIFRATFALLILLVFSGLSAQEINRRAVRLTDKAEEAVKVRQFEEAISLLKKAIDIDPAYGKPYLRLATIFNLYQQADSAAHYYNQYTEVTPLEEIDEQMWNRVAGLNYSLGNYEKAQQAIGNVSNPDALLLESIDFSITSVAEDVQLQIEELPPAINAYQLQYFPVLTVDERTIIYTKRDANHPTADEDLVISMKINDRWIPSQSISPRINSPFNEGACTISADGSTLIFTACEGRKSLGSCDLYITYRSGNSWSTPENLGSPVNTKYWESQPSLSADGRELYFSSNRPGGKGKRDIWHTSQGASGWGEPKNLGNAVNTSYDETTPFIHVNRNLLFFSSQGHPGLGGFDLFYTEKQNDIWSDPENLGYPINSTNDELSLFINASGSHGYYAREVSDGAVTLSSNIVRFEVPFDSLVRQKASYVTGRIYDEKTSRPLGATLKMANLNDSTDTYKVKSDSISGRYYLVLTADNEYGVFIQKRGYLFEDLRFAPASSSALHPDTLNIALQRIAGGSSLTLENIYFEFNKYQLNPKSRSELNEIADYLNVNNDVQFEIQGHTDDVGSEQYNLQLSAKRAEEVYQYLLKKGVERSRMNFKGFGSSEPIATNDTEQGRQRNRRITFMVVSN